MKKLSVLLGQDFSPDVDIVSMSSDSRMIKSGSLFAAVPGARTDGRSFIAEAIKLGAAAILVPKGTPKVEMPAEQMLAWIEDENPRHLFSQMAAKFYGAEPKNIAAVTGTNGKTSTVNFALQIWEKLNLKGASLGTLGIRGKNVDKDGVMTTPDPVTLHAHLADLSAAGITHLALEASSHGLHQHRLDGVKIKAAGFTNLTRDHLDYHQTMDAYRTSKLRLFAEVIEPGGIAVINADTPEAQQIMAICADRKITCWTYGFKGKEFKLLDREPTPHGQMLKLEFMGRRCSFTLPLVGAFQVMNVLCAAGLVAALDQKKIDDIIDVLTRVEGVPGRLQLVQGHKKGAAVYVDYAHTPDALENILTSLRPHVAGKLFCLFGCGGDRDRGKRPVMGGIAAKLADVVIVTDDNPRSEDPVEIRKAILEGAPGAQEIDGRRNAIKYAIGMLEKGDILVIAGKGHEQGQIFADRVDPFDDVTEADSAMREAS
jgi:UDP-N-acetylmuramoyl-L-alanyl-D-glutamate--2,6-diaminopimelate ligase